jgi:CcmD family protein
MFKSFSIILSFLFIYSINTHAQDKLNYNGKHYQFIPGASDTMKNNGDTYIIKYVEEPDEATIMRSNGKIYVVVMVLATIFAGIFAYLVYLDRKISRLEKDK